MDVTAVEHVFYPASKISDTAEAVRPEVSVAEKGVKSVAEDFSPEEVLMDLDDVRNFLYMLIGSSVEVKSEGGTTGRNVNTVA